MKRVLIGILLLIGLGGCQSKLHSISTYQMWDELIDAKLAGDYSQSLMYDLREGTNCDEGHVSGFLCIFYGNNLTIFQIQFNIEAIYSKNALILLMCEDGAISQELGDALVAKGYRHVYYYAGGYDAYSHTKPNFIPEIGCNC
ncbi:MAG: rhodanese-like domain-containing protein [Bacilli bacterium]